MSLEQAITQAVRAGVQDALQHSQRIAITVEPRMYSGNQAREMLGMNTEEFYAAIRSGELRAIRRGLRNWQISSVALFEYIAQLEGRAGVLRLESIAHAAD